MEVVASWTKALCVDISQGRIPNHVDDVKAEASELGNKVLSSWSVLDIGTRNSLLLQELAKQGFSYLTGTDYSEGAISLAQSVANRVANRDVFFFELIEKTEQIEPKLVWFGSDGFNKKSNQTESQLNYTIGSEDFFLKNQTKPHREYPYCYFFMPTTRKPIIY
ncbi:uncharacterized protein LOC107648022 [Arachis ipaensis]|uniref:uncharacterized protein LOC107648022 n=1 Tax=Arachis ipaensis TaxID=130454 RepID=UPI0007AF5187|nr:uncharacterized protein LOC107648022 [Arachis ipaensis]XP_025663399.1 uncharacterized protein LOC112758841 [Arachis hypogaea]